MIKFRSLPYLAPFLTFLGNYSFLEMIKTHFYVTTIEILQKFYIHSMKLTNGCFVASDMLLFKEKKPLEPAFSMMSDFH